MLKALTSLGTINLLSHGTLVSVSLFTLLLHHIFTTVWVKLGIFPHYSLYGSNLGSFNATV